MKTNVEHSRLPLWTLLLVLICFTIPIQAATNDLSLLLQKGLFEDEANHNLEAATEAYQSVIKNFDRDRKLAATAVFRLGEIYRKQGKTNEANAQYERILREFSDQKQVAELSKKYLPAGSTSPAITSPLLATRAEISEYEQLLSDLSKVDKKELPLALTVALPQTDSQLESLLKRKAAEEQKLASLRADYGSDHPDVRRVVAVVSAVDDQLNTRAESIIRGLETRLSAARARLKELEEGKIQPSPPSVGNKMQEITSTEAEEIRRIQALIRNSPDLIEAKGTNGFTPLQDAAYKGHLAVISYLLDNGAQLEPPGASPLNLAAGNGHLAVTERLIKQGADVSRSYALVAAARKGYRAVIELLLKNGADPNLGDPLHNAAEGGHLEVVKLLVESGADVNAPARSRQPESISRGRVQYNVTGITPLHRAARNNHTAVVSYLLQKGADSNAQDSTGYSPLYEVFRLGNNDLIKLFLQHGASVDIKAVDGSTALHLAVLDGVPRIVETILTQKPNLEAENNDGTPLQQTAQPEIAALLLKAGANPNVTDRDGATPLIRAVDRRNVELVKVLLEHGADPNVMMSNGTTALSVAKQIAPSNKQGAEMVSLLLKAGANENLQRLTRIAVVRPTANLHHVVFYKTTNFNNQFTLFEAISEAYSPSMPGAQSANLRFPDFANLRIKRLENGEEKIIPVNVAEALDAGDCTKDIPLHWGDLIEIPELDHRLDDQWFWPSHWVANLKICVRRKVEVVVKGVRTPFILQSQLIVGTIGTDKSPITTNAPTEKVLTAKWTTSVVLYSGLLLASSDPSRLKIKRTDPKTGKMTEFIVSRETNSPPNDLWLMEGDVIEIPDRDPNAPQPVPETRSFGTRTLRVPPPQQPVPSNP